jgi:hypothetical protein
LVFLTTFEKFKGENIVIELQIIDKIYAGLHEELVEISQSRSAFQLVHFVVQSHGNIESGAGPRMRYQILREMQVMRGEIAKQVVDKERILRELTRIEKKEVPDVVDQDLDVMEKKILLANIEVELAGRLREFNVLHKILQTIPKYTREDHDNAEVKYWTQRLERQYRQGLVASHAGIDRGDLTAMEQCSGSEMIADVGKITEWKLPVIKRDGEVGQLNQTASQGQID